MHPTLRAACNSPLFTATSSASLLLDRNLVICAANDQYERIAGREKSALVGSSLLNTVAPASALDLTNHVRPLAQSLEHVLTTGMPDHIEFERYVTTPDSGGAPQRHGWWSVYNSPLRDEDAVIGVLHELVGRADAHDGHREQKSQSSLDDVVLPTARDQIWHQIAHRVQQSEAHCYELLCDVALKVLPGGGGVVIALRHVSEQPLVVAATDDRAREIEDLQSLTGEGPSVMAFRTGKQAMHQSSDGLDPRWPTFAEAAARHGVHQVLAFPMTVGSTTFGSVAFYTHASTGESPPIREAAAVAQVASVLVAEDLREESLEQLSVATGTDRVNIAIGIIAASQRIRPADAAVQLRAEAFRRDQPLADLAAEVVARRDLADGHNPA